RGVDEAPNSPASQTRWGTDCFRPSAILRCNAPRSMGFHALQRANRTEHRSIRTIVPPVFTERIARIVQKILRALLRRVALLAANDQLSKERRLVACEVDRVNVKESHAAGQQGHVAKEGCLKARQFCTSDIEGLNGYVTTDSPPRSEGGASCPARVRDDRA